jgi:serine protease inhibitor
MVIKSVIFTLVALCTGTVDTTTGDVCAIIDSVKKKDIRKVNKYLFELVIIDFIFN